MFYDCEIVFLEELEFVGDRNYRALFNIYSLFLVISIKKNLIARASLYFTCFCGTEKWRGIIKLVIQV
jgi:hypothetical protein